MSNYNTNYSWHVFDWHPDSWYHLGQMPILNEDIQQVIRCYSYNACKVMISSAVTSYKDDTRTFKCSGCKWCVVVRRVRGVENEQLPFWILDKQKYKSPEDYNDLNRHEKCSILAEVVHPATIPMILANYPPFQDLVALKIGPNAANIKDKRNISIPDDFLWKLFHLKKNDGVNKLEIHILKKNARIALREVVVYISKHGPRRLFSNNFSNNTTIPHRNIPGGTPLMQTEHNGMMPIPCPNVNHATPMHMHMQQLTTMATLHMEHQMINMKEQMINLERRFYMQKQLYQQHHLEFKKKFNMLTLINYQPPPTSNGMMPVTCRNIPQTMTLNMERQMINMQDQMINLERRFIMQKQQYLQQLNMQEHTMIKMYKRCAMPPLHPIPSTNYGTIPTCEHPPQQQLMTRHPHPSIKIKYQTMPTCDPPPPTMPINMQQQLMMPPQHPVPQTIGGTVSMEVQAAHTLPLTCYGANSMAGHEDGQALLDLKSVNSNNIAKEFSQTMTESGLGLSQFSVETNTSVETETREDICTKGLSQSSSSSDPYILGYGLTLLSMATNYTSETDMTEVMAGNEFMQHNEDTLSAGSTNSAETETTEDTSGNTSGNQMFAGTQKSGESVKLIERGWSPTTVQAAQSLPSTSYEANSMAWHEDCKSSLDLKSNNIATELSQTMTDSGVGLSQFSAETNTSEETEKMQEICINGFSQLSSAADDVVLQVPAGSTHSTETETTEETYSNQMFACTQNSAESVKLIERGRSPAAVQAAQSLPSTSYEANSMAGHEDCKSSLDLKSVKSNNIAMEMSQYAETEKTKEGHDNQCLQQVEATKIDNHHDYTRGSSQTSSLSIPKKTPANFQTSKRYSRRIIKQNTAKRQKTTDVVDISKSDGEEDDTDEEVENSSVLKVICFNMYYISCHVYQLMLSNPELLSFIIICIYVPICRN